jgi:DNA-binding beta-propeller fold protein YncE
MRAANPVRRVFAWLLLAVLLLAGCATAPPSSVGGPVFYPSPPNPPHIQYLTSFSLPRDVQEKSAFADYVFGQEGKRDTAITKPYGVAVHQGKIYVVDTRGPGYAVFDLTARRFNIVSGYGNGKMKKPINITIDADGTKYITDTDRSQILVFDAEDRFLRAFGEEGQFKPSDVAIAGDRLYVVDLKGRKIQVLEKMTGKVLSSFGSPGSKEGEIFDATNIALGPEGDIYVTDTGNFRVERFSPEGKFIRSYGQLGDAVGNFARPKGIALDRAGRIYVSDAAFENVQVFDNSGRLLMFFGESGERPENLNLPAAVAIDYDNVALFQKYADPKFTLEYVILVANQFGFSKVNVYGFGRLAGADYSATKDSAAGSRP